MEREEYFDTTAYADLARVADRLLTPVTVIAPDSTLLYANRVASRVFDTDVTQLLGRKMIHFVHPDDRAQVRRQLKKIAESNPTGGFTRFRIRGSHRQEWRFFNSYAHNLIDDPDVRGILVSGGDVTDEVKAKRQLDSSREFLLAITDNMAEGMIATDGEGTITFVNAAAGKLFERSSSELIGKPVWEGFHLKSGDEHFRRDGSRLLSNVWARGESLKVAHDTILRHDGADVAVAYSASPLKENGLSGAVIVFEDITQRVAEQVKVEREMEKLEWVGRIRDALDNGRFVLYSQPIVDLRNFDVVQHELLIRMVTPGATS